MWIVANKNRIKLVITLLIIGVVLWGATMLLNNISTNGVWEWTIYSFGLLFLLPIGTIKLFFKEPLTDYQIVFFKEQGRIWKIVGTIFFLMLTVIIILLTKYPSAEIIWQKERINLIFLIDFLIMPWVVIFQEVFFRGFLQKILSDNFNGIIAVVTQAIVFTMFLVLSSYQEGGVSNFYLLGLFLGGVLLGIIVKLSRSILISGVFHWVALVLIDLYMVYNISGLL